jgi:uncharacterized protein YcfJ
MTKMKKTLAVLALAASSVLLPACRTGAQTGALLGTGLGALAGGVIGHQNGHRGAGTLIGAGAGAIGGYLIGNETDKAQHGSHYEGDPRYEPGYRSGGGGYEGGGERVIYRERTVYEGEDCGECR